MWVNVQSRSKWVVSWWDVPAHTLQLRKNAEVAWQIDHLDVEHCNTRRKLIRHLGYRSYLRCGLSDCYRLGYLYPRFLAPPFCRDPLKAENWFLQLMYKNHDSDSSNGLDTELLWLHDCSLCMAVLQIIPACQVLHVLEHKSYKFQLAKKNCLNSGFHT